MPRESAEKLPLGTGKGSAMHKELLEEMTWFSRLTACWTEEKVSFRVDDLGHLLDAMEILYVNEKYNGP